MRTETQYRYLTELKIGADSSNSFLILKNLFFQK
jgi:hypothetical protein